MGRKLDSKLTKEGNAESYLMHMCHQQYLSFIRSRRRRQERTCTLDVADTQVHGGEELLVHVVNARSVVERLMHSLSARDRMLIQHWMGVEHFTLQQLQYPTWSAVNKAVSRKRKQWGETLKTFGESGE